MERESAHDGKKYPLAESVDPRTPRRPGVGLRIVNERLKIHFGPDYRLRIDPARGGHSDSDPPSRPA